MVQLLRYAAVVATVLVAAPFALQAEPAALIQERQDFMKKLGGEMKVIGDYLKKGEGTVEDVEAAARRIAERAEDIPALFPDGTAMHEVDVETGARPEIWEDFADFTAKAEKTSASALAFAEEIAEKGEDRAAIASGFASLGREGCGACHKVYREDLD